MGYEPHPVGKPYFFDLPALKSWLSWLLTADSDERDQFLGGDAGAHWADRVGRALDFVESEQAGRPINPKPAGVCEDCGLIYAECRCGEDEEDDREEWLRCGCPYCFCHTRTEYGESCPDCVNHAHQG